MHLDTVFVVLKNEPYQEQVLEFIHRFQSASHKVIKIISCMLKQLSCEKFLIAPNNNPPTFFRQRDQSRSPRINAYVKSALSTSTRYCLKDTYIAYNGERTRQSLLAEQKEAGRLPSGVHDLLVAHVGERAPLMNIAIYEGDVQREVHARTHGWTKGEKRDKTYRGETPGQRSSANRIYPKTRQQASQWDPPLFDVEQSTKTLLRIRERDGAWTLMHVPA